MRDQWGYMVLEVVGEWKGLWLVVNRSPKLYAVDGGVGGPQS